MSGRISFHGPHPLFVWLIASLVYAVAVAQRSTIGVSVEAAADRYGVTVVTLSLLPITQLLVYAVMQVPAGRMLDRFGARWTLTCGAIAVALGQTILALTPDLLAACASRLLVSLGDSVAFVSVLRLVMLRLAPRKATLLAQLTGVLGQFGAIAAAAPFLLLLQTWSWTPAFLVASGIGLVAALCALVVIRDDPRTVTIPTERSTVGVLWRDPGTRLGYWVHFTMTFPTTGFLLYWGMPYLTQSGLTPDRAGVIMSVVSAAGIAVGLVIATAVARWPDRGFVMCLSVSTICLTFWSTILLFATPPAWLIVSTAIATGASAPCGVVAFKYLRPAYGEQTSSTATGVVNSAGFTASILAIIGVAGLSLAVERWMGTSSIRLGLTAQFALWALGFIMMARSFRQFRRRVESHQPA